MNELKALSTEMAQHTRQTTDYKHMDSYTVNQLNFTAVKFHLA